ISEENVENIISAPLPDGYLRLSVEALEKILPYMRHGLMYSEACKEAEYQHYMPLSDEVIDELPHYTEPLQRYLLADGSKIANPTVHIALNQLRKIINAIVKRYGNPQQIVVEMARDLPMGAEERRKIINLQKDNQKENERIRKAIEDLERTPSIDSILRYKLWEEQRHRCIYSGKTINAAEALSHECEIDHILPYSKTHDDSKSNKVLCFKSSNQYKRDRSPYEVWGDTDNYLEILDRAKELPAGKRWRFESSAMEKFDKQDEFLDSQLNDTRYMSRVAKEYLNCICKLNRNGNKDVWTVNGALTGMLRRAMGLNNILGDTGEKNRNDHRHHAVDAVIVGIVDRSMIQKIHSIAKRYDSNSRVDKLNKMLGEMLPPFPLGSNIQIVKDEFRCRVAKSINNIIVSHKPDHGKEGALHEETAYGRLADGTFFTHKEGVSKRTPTIEVRHKDKSGKIHYKWFMSGGNYYVDIIDNNGKPEMECVTIFKANQRGVDENWWRDRYPQGKLVMRLYKSDILEYEGKYYVIAGLDPDGSRVKCVPVNDARDSKNRDDRRIGKTELLKNAKHVTIDFLGNVHPAKKIES
ncbi:MAG: type II CRISPR RNA-guided endonuclease Cas9, partial [Deferribacteraceae bacterium]|nr:type II CRISPR RNA-guided endonuclease Cas9 [Deferribacteraceae bacterium]